VSLGASFERQACALTKRVSATHLGSAKMRSRHCLGPAHHLPENAASLASLPLGPVLRRGFGFSAPQPPGVLMKRPGL